MKLDKTLKLTNVVFALIVLVLIGAFLRLYNLERMAYHHDESMHAYYSYNLYRQGPVATKNEMSHYDPVYHGPFLYHIGAAFFFLFGDSDFTGRLPFAVLGILTLLIAYGLHVVEGKRTALITVFLLSISPVMVYFSRFARNDVYVGMENLALVVFSILYFKTRKPLYFYLAVLGLILGYCTKENSYMSGAIFGSFAVYYFLASAFAGFFVFLLVFGVVASGGVFALLLALNKPFVFATWGGVGSLLFFIMFALASTLFSPKSEEESKRVLGKTFSTYAPFTRGLALYGLFSFFMFTFVYLRERGLSESFPNVLQVLYWVLAIAVTVFAFLLLSKAKKRFCQYDPYRPKAESQIGKAGEDQQEQDFWTVFFRILEENQLLIFSFCMALGIYIVLFTTLFSNKQGLVDGVYKYLSYWIGQQHEPRIPGPWWYHLPRLAVYEMVLVIFSVLAIGNVCFRAILSVFKRERVQVDSEGSDGPAKSENSSYWLPVFLSYWTITSVVIYAFLNEKVPWLLVHQALPMALLTGWFCGEMWKRLRGDLVTTVLRWALLIVFVVFSSFGIRASVVLNFFNNDDPKEMIVYVQSQHDIIEILDEIDDLSFKLTTRKNTRIHLQGKCQWPMSWYLRHYPCGFGSVPDNVNAPIVLGDSNDRKQIRLKLGKDYDEGRQYHLQGWWVVDRDPLFKNYGKFAFFKFNKWFPKFWKYYCKREAWQKEGFGYWDIVMFLKADIFGIAELQEGPAFQEGYKKPPAYPSVLKMWGQQGDGPGAFNEPRGLAINPENTAIYVADSKNHRIQKFDLDGNFLKMWGTNGKSPGQFQEPTGICVGPDGMVYVTDTWNLRIQKFDPDGELITMWKAEPKAFYGPRDVGVSSENEVFISDTGNKRIVVYTADGKFLREWGGGGSSRGKFDEQVGLAISKDNLVYVADTTNQRIQVFDTQGTYLRQWNAMGWESLYPQPYLAVDAKGNIYATDSTQSIIHRFLPHGVDVTTYGRKGQGSGQIQGAIGIALDADSNVYVADTGNHRIQKWAPLRHYK